MVADGGCSVQVPNCFNINLLVSTQPVLLWQCATTKNRCVNVQITAIVYG